MTMLLPNAVRTVNYYHLAANLRRMQQTPLVLRIYQQEELFLKK